MDDRPTARQRAARAPDSLAPDSRPRLPDWLRVRLPGGGPAADTTRRLRRLGLHTVCEEARCPNQGECWGAGTATLMILGDTCTRACRFCAVRTGNPRRALDAGEPEAAARAVAEAGLRYVVLTSVDRDDLPDGGAAHFAATVRAIRAAVPEVLVEVLAPDYLGADLRTVLAAGPRVFAHNVEVVPRLAPCVRDRRASWDRSIECLRQAREVAPAIPTKSSLMVGLGEEPDEVLDALHALRGAGVAIVTIGQYLRPSARHHPVARYVPPGEFAEIEAIARGMGFEFVAAGPLVRSSYRAAELFATRRLDARAAELFATRHLDARTAELFATRHLDARTAELLATRRLDARTAELFATRRLDARAGGCGGDRGDAG
ncbi:MAG: lipoyl synthase [Deltaproteobacteria bacterium]|nr:lipoyl synthase [Deltaproteobacteria bacterium]